MNSCDCHIDSVAFELFLVSMEKEVGIEASRSFPVWVRSIWLMRRVSSAGNDKAIAFLREWKWEYGTDWSPLHVDHLLLANFQLSHTFSTNCYPQKETLSWIILSTVFSREGIELKRRWREVADTSHLFKVAPNRRYVHEDPWLLICEMSDADSTDLPNVYSLMKYPKLSILCVSNTLFGNILTLCEWTILIILIFETWLMAPLCYVIFVPPKNSDSVQRTFQIKKGNFNIWNRSWVPIIYLEFPYTS